MWMEGHEAEHSRMAKWEFRIDLKSTIMYGKVIKKCQLKFEGHSKQLLKGPIAWIF
jgi:hypothetical protein